MGYNFTVKWVKGILNNAPDALSRNAVSDPQPSGILAESDMDNNPKNTLMEVRAILNDHQENVWLQDLCKHAVEDYKYRQVPDTFWSDQGPQFTTNHFKTLQRHGDFSISHHHLCTHKVMVKSKQP